VGLEPDGAEIVPRGEADLGVEGCREPTKQGNGRLGAALLDALDFVIRHARTLGKVGDGEAEGGADVIPDGGDTRRTTVTGVDGERIRRKPVLDGWSTNKRPPPSARKSLQVTGRILVSCGKRAISSNLSGTIITSFTGLFIPR
jgi:hypothetical protein